MHIRLGCISIWEAAPVALLVYYLAHFIIIIWCIETPGRFLDVLKMAHMGKLRLRTILRCLSVCHRIANIPLSKATLGQSSHLHNASGGKSPISSVLLCSSTLGKGRKRRSCRSPGVLPLASSVSDSFIGGHLEWIPIDGAINADPHFVGMVLFVACV